METKKIIAAFESGDSDAVDQLNASLMAAVAPNAVSAGIVVVDSNYYSDPDQFTNKFEVWAKAFCDLTGLAEFKWFWKSVPVSSKNVEDLLAEPGDGQWTVVFYGPLFQKSKGLGALVFVADDSSMGYVLSKFTHGSDYYSGIVPIPSSVKRGKDVAAMIADAVSSWLSSQFTTWIEGVEGCTVDRNHGDFRIILELQSAQRSPQVQKNIQSWLSGAGFTNIEVHPMETDETELKVTCSHPLKLFKL